MATEPPPESWIGRNIHVIVWTILAVITAFGVSWLMMMPPDMDRSPAPLQASQPQTQPVAAVQSPADDKAASEKAADERTWAETSQAGSLAAFESYVRAYPSGAHVAEAQQRIAALGEGARRAAKTAARVAAQKAAEEKAAADKVADDRAWADATQVGSVAAFETYIRNNTAGAMVAEAQQRIAALNAQTRQAAEAQAAAEKAAQERAAADRATAERATAERLAAERAASERAVAEREAAERAAAASAAADERAWVEAAQAGTLVALETYLRNNPAGSRSADARQRIAVINEQTRHEQEQRAAAERLAAEQAAAEKVAAERAVDGQAFARATQTGSIEGYETYIRDNAAGAHVMEAARRIAHLRAATEKKRNGAKTAGSAPRDRPLTSGPYVRQRPVYKAPPMSALR